ncbi:MAG: ABC transporter ATP-binding protein [Candidatus Cloacimonetes bacterium 4572_55]|nr:MAG: ABC transporter ATP-binding protein [Candidatus Cloacimonetes bacterium 4572_55]
MSQTDFYEEGYHNRFDAGLWKRVIRFIKPYRVYVAFLAAVMIMVGVIEAIFPLMSLYAIDNFVIPGNISGFPQFMVTYFLTVVIFALNIWLLISIAGKIDMWVCYDIRRAGFQRLQELSFSYFDRTPVGWLMARMTSDTGRLADVLAWGIVDIIWGSTLMVAISGIMLYLNWKLALIVLSTVPFLVVISGKFQVLILRSYRDVRKTNSKITGSFNEGICGAKTTKTLTREKGNLTEFSELTDRMFRSSFLAAVQSAIYLPFVLIISMIGSGLALWFGGNGVIAGSITYGTLVAFISYAMRFFEPVQELARIFTELQNAQASAERIFAMIETKPEIEDSPDILKPASLSKIPMNRASSRNGNGTGYHKRQLGDREIKIAHPEKMVGKIEFRDVTFAYKKGEEVLHRFNLIVSPGETIALVGETGSGKSTIVNLACRFYEPTSGKVTIDGYDYKKLSLHWLQSNLGVVLQTPHLFSGTVRDNIRYGKLQASDLEVIQAAKSVHAHDFIMEMEDGYKSEVGEDGNLLSTGQKQLISFARAILAAPRLFIMDEATSSVDTETEQLIQKAINRVLAGRTSFIIAHRLSTIRQADRILVIDKGKVIEQGAHQELIRRKGRYYRLYTNQFKNESTLNI